MRKLVVALAALAAAIVFPGNADAAGVTGSCVATASTGQQYSVVAELQHQPAQGRTYITGYWWNIATAGDRATLGNRNNVTLEVVAMNRAGTKVVIDRWTSGDDIRSGQTWTGRSYSTPLGYVRAQLRLRVTFDRPFGSDPSCIATTRWAGE